MMRTRLRLALGAAAVLADELPPDGPRHRFLARGTGDPADGPATRLVTVHPPPPGGPHAGMVLDRLAAIRVLGHPGLAAPLATGAFDDGTWVVEAIPTRATLAERVQEGSPLAVQEIVRVLRDTARALSALHRQGLSHGALEADAIELGGEHAVLHRLGGRTDGTVRGDLDALGAIAAMTLEAREAGLPPTRRDRVPGELVTLVAQLRDEQPGRRPATAEAVLERLDWFPATRRGALASLVDGAGRGARAPGERRLAIGLAIIGLAMLAVWLFARA